MNIINQIEYQLLQIEKLFEESVKNENLTYYYRFCQKEAVFLDTKKLNLFLKENDADLFTLKRIAKLCINILEYEEINLRGFKLEDLHELKEVLIYDSKPIKYNFNAIYIKDNEFIYYSTISEKKKFLKEHNSKEFFLAELTNRIDKLLNILKANYNEIETELSLQIYLLRYQRNKIFRFKDLFEIEPFNKNQFEAVNKRLGLFKKRYDYIFKNLQGNKRIEFKYDTIDYLKKISNKEVLEKYKVVINSTIKAIEDKKETSIDAGSNKDKKDAEALNLKDKKEVNEFCESMDLDIPRNHFKRLTSNNSKNGKPFLTEMQLENFIQRAFLGNKDLSKQKINYVVREKLLVQYVFKEFFDEHHLYFNYGEGLKKCLELLTENFEKWEYKNVYDTKGKKPKHPLTLHN